ncbi:histidine phosphotransferase ChpT [Phenylobacterium sp.]|uniref:histidine phosphotransferase ChpT n=1 Tax=Phenylobacterium sp. TaxID=1871053 RepID=UPI002730A9C3|nr:histidine phosphotransferase family protein [Phenylobacterium sp.]MDP1875541.1 histidine phosphotransferase family protein [Phenylobacterium sp.]MDP3490945.1 histidine phosphotransferase family protein [Phenylobacterium sp.]
MTDAAPTPESPIDLSAQTVGAAQIAAFLAARMCHDFISPVSAIVSGLDLLEDPDAQDMREDAMGLIAASGRKLAEMLSFTRVAFGASSSAEVFDPRELENLAQGVFGHQRAELNWSVEAQSLDKASARTVLNVAQMAGGALPLGGVARLKAAKDGSSTVIVAESVGPKARLRPEVAAGLRGERLPDGALHGHWVQAYYVHLFVTEAGGKIFAEAGEEKVTFAATIPDA